MATRHADQAPLAPEASRRTAAHCLPRDDGELEPGEVASEEYERKVFTTPGVVEALEEALQEAEALKRSS